MSDRQLNNYQAKRDFQHTSEPRSSKRSTAQNKSTFIVQKHDARRLHYDFRLQVGNVLASWAIPKGPSMNPQDKRFATPTEDHPLDYQNFEGVIPEGNYGAGTVLLWDKGTYRNITEHKGKPVPIEQAIDNGHISISLDGKKLHGGYALTRIRKGKSEAWLLVKEKDANADRRSDVLNTKPDSVITGRNLDEIAEQES